MSQLCVQILLHCICLPYGAEKLCDEVENAFSDDDWRERSSAVEKVTVIARFLEKEHIKSNSIVMSALAHCFTYLVGAVEDVCTPVHLRYNTLSSYLGGMVPSYKLGSICSLLLYLVVFSFQRMRRLG